MTNTNNISNTNTNINNTTLNMNEIDNNNNNNTTLNVNVIEIEQPPLCANRCGFYGNPSTQNLCSVCFRINKKASLQETQIKPVPDNNNNINNNQDDPKNTSVAEYNNQDTSSNISSSSSDSKKVSNKINRCDTCNKRVGLTGFKCRCGGLYCGTHRHPEEHECGFDHKALKHGFLSKQLNANASEFKASKLDYKA